MQLDKEHVLAEIRRLASESRGKPPGQKRFAADTGIREHDWRRYWARWSDALAEAGFQPNEWNAPLDTETVLSRLASEVRRLGRLPNGRERELLHREDATFPSENVFRRMGSKRDLVGKLADHCRDRSDLADVLAIIGPLLVRPESDADERVEPVIGFVYMMRSGRYYNAGRSNSVGRREYELAIQLPEPVREVHRIATDDPAGVEQYWHRRFADRRKGGEWFDLKPADVSAFRSWRHM